MACVLLLEAVEGGLSHSFAASKGRREGAAAGAQTAQKKRLARTARDGVSQ